MKLAIASIAILTLIFTSCNDTDKKKKEMNEETASKIITKEQDYPFYVGTYTGGDSDGIYRYVLNSDGSLTKIGLAVTSNNPSFLTFSADKKFLLAVNEIQNENGMGTVESFAISADTLSFISRSPSAGAHPCFIGTNEDNYVLTANYTGGNIGLLQLDHTGSLTGLLDTQNHKGKGTTDRQEAPHAHSAWFEGESNIIAVDLGTNELWFSQLDRVQKKLIPSKPNTLKLAPGAGPRHLTFHPTQAWLYVINELNATITLVKKNIEGDYEVADSIGTLPEDYTGENSCADIHISDDGKFLYASNRGHNSIVMYEVNQQTGNLKLLGHESTKGDGPRNFSLSPDGKFVIVANQKTNNIVSYQRDPETGLLRFLSEIDAPTPVCILFDHM